MTYLTSASDITSLINKYTQSKILWIDTEVADYQSRNPRLSLIQILDNPEDMTGKSIYLLDVLDQNKIINDFIDRIMGNENIEKVFHNASYDLRFLGGKNARNVTCTLELAKKLPDYLLQVSNYKLATLAEELCNFNDVNKEEQSSDWGRRPLTNTQIEYAYLDCIYLAQVYLKLIDLEKEINPDPSQEDLVSLTARYREIEQKQKLINSEYEYLKERMKKAMLTQNILETKYCKMSSFERKTVKTQFQDLANLVITENIDLDFCVTLTEDIRKKLGENIENLQVNVEKNTYWKITAKNPEDREY
ncbi:ribonuclease D [Anabaena sp. FACHB-1237]|uniref:ribonuclease D n=1 Tax=Anabaena sp. FACHB-1237 TaxID=2692769 RepID=UPI001681372B|nr:ribonuclease D [Anabaena sp. FACHB-1237]MBD2137603.1 ribonuclease D [Anabaena sp. FACHB-1237]